MAARPKAAGNEGAKSEAMKRTEAQRPTGAEGNDEGGAAKALSGVRHPGLKVLCREVPEPAINEARNGMQWSVRARLIDGKADSGERGSPVRAHRETTRRPVGEGLNKQKT